MTARTHQQWEQRLLRTEKIFSSMPDGWRICHGASAPRGYAWINNGKSLFSKEYRHALLKTA